MKTKFLFFLMLGSAGLASAVGTTSTESTLHEVFNARVELTKAVASGEVTVIDGLQRLKEAKTIAASRQTLGVDVAFGEESLAIGYLLLGLDRRDAAEAFFRAAEEALARASQAASDASAKAGYLEKLAAIRANFLNKPTQAKADIDEAIRLRPEDKELQQRRAFLARGRAEAFNPTAGK